MQKASGGEGLGDFGAELSLERKVVFNRVVEKGQVQ
jgi:hypothetical protein